MKQSILYESSTWNVYDVATQNRLFVKTTLAIVLFILTSTIVSNQTAMAKNCGDEELLKKAGLYFLQNRHDKAFPLYKQYLKKNPNCGDARAALAWMIFQSRMINPKAIPDALKEAEKAVKLSPKSPLAHNVLGAIYFSQGRVPEAQREFITVLQIDPKRKCAGCGDMSGLLFVGTKYDNSGKAFQEHMKKLKSKKRK